MLLVCSWSFHATGQVPVGVGFVVPPWVMRTGPSVTAPFASNHACLVDRLTQALTFGAHGGGGGGVTVVVVVTGAVVVVVVVGGLGSVGAGPAAAWVAQPDSSAT